MTAPFTLLSIPTTKSTYQVVRQFPFPITFTAGSYQDIAVVIHAGDVRIFHRGVDIRTFSFVWIASGWHNRPIAYALDLYLTATGTPHSYAESSPSKVTDGITFALAGLPVPDTVFLARGAVASNMALLRDHCGYPLIIKDTKGAKGKHLAHVATEADLPSALAALPAHRKFLFQRHIPNDYDWGIMVVNGTVVAGARRYAADGEFRNNICNGGQEHFVAVADVPPTIAAIAIQASALLGLSWSRADIIIDRATGLPYLLEVNRYPGITPGSDEVRGAYAFLASHISPTV